MTHHGALSGSHGLFDPEMASQRPISWFQFRYWRRHRLAQEGEAQREIEREVYIVGCAGVPTFGRLVEVDDVTLCGEFGRHLAGVAGMHPVITC